MTEAGIIKAAGEVPWVWGPVLAVLLWKLITLLRRDHHDTKASEDGTKLRQDLMKIIEEQRKRADTFANERNEALERAVAAEARADRVEHDIATLRRHITFSQGRCVDPDAIPCGLSAD